MTPTQIAKMIYDLMCAYTDCDCKTIGNPNNSLKVWNFEVLGEDELGNQVHEICFYVKIRDGQIPMLISMILQRAYDLDKINFVYNPISLKESKQNNLYLKAYLS